MAGKPLKMQYQSLAELVMESIMDYIMDDKIHMGEKLNTEDLAQELGVSRMPVRDAIKSLEKMGLVVSTPYVGSYVVSLDENDVREIFVGRKSLEPTLAFWACENMTDEKLKEIEKIHNKLIEVCEEETMSAKKIFLLNKEFHFAIYREAGFNRLFDMVESLWNNLAFCKLIYCQDFAKSRESARRMLREHEGFLDALRERDSNLLSELVHQSLKRNETIVPRKMAERAGERK